MLKLNKKVNNLILKNHPYHLVSVSPWPLYCSLVLFSLISGGLNYLIYKDLNLFLISLSILFLVLFHWWRDIIREGYLLGDHTSLVNYGLRLGMILFILSEIMFFFSFFWSYFHMYLSPSIEIGGLWPPKMVFMLSPFNLPLLNTLLLLCSGYTLTFSHYSLLYKNSNFFIFGLILTCVLGLIFIFIQFVEYKNNLFSISDSVFGSIFFLLTGFHGLHVIIGVSFLLLILYRSCKLSFSTLVHKGFEFSSWYWHFVDVVWLLVYIFLYWLPF